MTTQERPSLRVFLFRTKKGRTILIAALFGGLLLLVPHALGRKKPPGGPPAGGAASQAERGPEGEAPLSGSGFADTIVPGQKYDLLISRFGLNLDDTRNLLERTRQELETLRSKVGQEARAAQEKKGATGLPPPAPEIPAQAPALPAGREPGAPKDRAGTASPAGGLRVIALGSPASREKKEKRPVRIPTASGGMGTTLNGTFAALSGEPSPIRLRFDSAVIGPNHGRIPLRGAYLIGKASGDANSCRVSVQIDKFSMVKEKGEAIEAKALGYVVGEDGLEGIPGSYEWRAWEFLPLAVGTGGLQGLSGALAQGQLTTTLTPLGGSTSVLSGDSMKLAGTQAAGGASGKLGEIVAERMKEIRPAVSTPAGRKVTIVFLDGLSLEGVDFEELEGSHESDPFYRLDHPR